MKNYKFKKSCELLEDHVDFRDSGRQVASLIFLFFKIPKWCHFIKKINYGTTNNMHY